ncbi:MAG TPA: hypothetical protein VHW02_04525 [Rhizomicrobium sp.]|nr:hypothetical protein [Rhizomicrobium sp.]
MTDGKKKKIMAATDAEIQQLVNEFIDELQPVEGADGLKLFTDNRTGARYAECHVYGKKLVEFSTTDVPLDPETQAQYRANRNVVTDDATFVVMKVDALQRRSFSNLVTEYTKEIGSEKPLKIIGGQHRYEAIRLAAEKGVNEIHSIKVYFGLDMAQRLDVQLISNTNIEVSGALADRLKETARGPDLRDWCQRVGLLKTGEDFGDTKSRGGPVTVDLARSFIRNYYDGKAVKESNFSNVETTPMLFVTGKDDGTWDAILSDHPKMWKDAALEKAGKEFVRLRDAQRASFSGRKGKIDFSEKAMNGAVLSAWAYTAGMLEGNSVRLARHFALADAKGKDPLNAEALADGRHKTDKETYRGLGYRTDARERASMVELFSILAEDGDKLTPAKVKAAIYAWFAKRAVLDANEQRGK